MKKIRFRVFIFLLAAATVYAACRKTDQVVKHPPGLTKEKFFGEHASTDPLVQSVINYMKGQDSKHHSVEKIVAQIGYPYWDKALRVAKAATSGRGNSSDSDHIVYIPFVRDTQNFVNAALLVKISPADTAYKFLCDWQYASFGFDSTGDGWNARDIFFVFAQLDRQVFERTDFIIKDEDLLTQQEKNYMSGLGLTFDSATVRYHLEPGQNLSGRSNLYMPVTICTDAYVCIKERDLLARSANQTGTSIVPGPCASGTWLVIPQCNDVWIYIPSGSEGGGAGGTGGTGGGGGGGTGTPPNCTGGGVARVMLQEGCQTGWVPVGGGGPLKPIFGIQSFVNNFTNPCIVAAKNKLPDFNLNIFANSLFFAPLSQTYNWTIIFEEDRTLVDAAGNPLPAQSFAVTPNKEWHVVLNPLFWEQSTQPNATQEIAGLNILHEIVHGFIRVYKDFLNLTTLNTFTTHEDMFKNSINAMSTILQQSFGLTAYEAKALAIQGLDDVLEKEYSASGVLTAYNAFYNQFAVTNYGISIPEAEVVFDQFLAGTKGVRCF